MLVDGEERDDTWLYQRLGFTFCPSDRELEISLISFMKKASDPTLYDFYNRVYDHFFGGGTKDSLQEGFEDAKKGDTDVTAKDTEVTKGDREKEKGTELNAMVVSNIPYKRDKLNPILKQTIQRIISIDSKYRNIVSKDFLASSASNFTIDLSEPLKDVLSIKLYSFQIPNTWYTVANTYGSNFFYLKGNVPGINTGVFDYQISVLAGNYSNADLVTNISKSMQDLKGQHPDVSFGMTDISYNSFDSKATFTIDIQNAYDQSNYYIDWVAQPNPSRGVIPPVFLDIPSYLGFVEETYSLKNVKALSINYPNTNQDSVQNIFYLNTSNQSVTFIEKNPTGGVDFSFHLTLTLPLEARYSRTQLQDNFQSVLAASSYVDSTRSSLTRVVETDVSYYDLSVYLNRLTVPLVIGDTLSVVFPVESVSAPFFPIWTGVGSCFHFADLSSSFFNTVTSENSVLVNSFPVLSVPVVQLSCLRKNYVDPSNVLVYPAYSLSGGGSFTLAQYTDGINAALQATIQPTHVTSTNQFFSSVSPVLQFDFNLYFSTSDYYVDLSGTVLGYLFYDIGGTSGPTLFDTPTFSGVLGADYLVTFPVPETLPLLYVKPRYARNGNRDVGANNLTYTMTHGVGPGITYAVPFVSSLVPLQGYYDYTFVNKNVFVKDVTASFAKFFYAPDNNYPVAFSTFAFGAVTAQGAPMTVTLSAQSILTQNDFSLLLYDQGSGPDLSSSWVTNFGFSASPYLLSDYHVGNNTYTDVSGAAYLKPSTYLYVDQGTNFFYIRPFSTSVGVYTTTPANKYSNYQYNDIRVEIEPGSYDTNTLQLAIQSAFSSNPLLKGSSFTYLPPVVGLNEPQYAQIQIVVSKVYTAQDYSLVFYDDFYFYKCYVGESSIRNTTWDTTLGWILGFRSTQYDLSNYIRGNVALMKGEVTTNVNLYSYFLITVDDYNQCRLNDGLVSITKPDSNLPLPSYAMMSENVCADMNQPLSLATGSTLVNQNNLTLNQVYNINQLNASLHTPISKSYSQGPFIKDIFGVIPLKTAGLQTGQVFSDYGGSLQQQERLYFGPVNIRRLQIQLFNNQGAIMDLNGADWSFSFVCEQLYQQAAT